MIRELKMWWAHRRLKRLKAKRRDKACQLLERLIARQRAKFAAEHPDFDRRRKAALRHEPRSWA